MRVPREMAPIRIRFAGYQGKGSIHTRAAQAFGAALQRRMGNRIAFELEDNILAHGHKSGDLLPMVARGDETMCYISTIRFSTEVPDFKTFELPFVIRDRARVFQALDGAPGRALTEQLHAATPYRVLGFWDNGFRHITNRLRPIRTPSDCRGMRIRTQMSDFIGETFRRIGFEPVALDIKTFLDGLDSAEPGSVDAQENPLTTILNFDLPKAHPHLTLTGHFFGVTLFLCNAAIFDTWSPDLREAVRLAAAEATEMQRALAIAQDEEGFDKLTRAGVGIVQLSDTERAAFADSVAPLVERHVAEFGSTLLDQLT